jgi:hypothetical protein
MTQSQSMPRQTRNRKRSVLVSTLLVAVLLLNLSLIQFANAAGTDNLASAFDISGSLPLLNDPTTQPARPETPVK